MKPTIPAVIETAVMLGILLGLFVTTGFFIGGRIGALAALSAVILWLAFGHSSATARRFYLKNALLLKPQSAPELYSILIPLSRRAGLKKIPQVYLLPSRAMNAFTIGSGADALLAITQGLVAGCTPRELAGVIAHEISHIKNNDGSIMNMAYGITRLTYYASNAGMILLVVIMPLMVVNGMEAPWLAGILILSAPLVSIIIQLALSRRREFLADRSAVELTGDPEALASALLKVNRQESWILSLVTGQRSQGSALSLLRSHPHIASRVKALLSKNYL